MEHAEQNAQLWKLLGSLRPKYREVLVLRYAESMRLEQIADALQMPLGTVKSRLSHAHAQLGEKLKRAELYVTSYELPRGASKDRANTR